MASTQTTANSIVADRTNTGIALVAVSWSLFSVSIVVVALRLWTRIVRFLHVGLDDYLMLISFICTLLHSTMVTVAFRYGMGRHSATLTPDNLVQAKHYIVACEAFAIVTVMFGRLSFCVFFLGILGPTHKKQRMTTWTVIICQIIGNIIVVVQVYAQCGTQLSALWDPAVRAVAHCQSPEIEEIFGYVQGILNVISDLVLTLLPGYLVWTLQIPRATKIGLGAVLMLSVFALVASILKAVAIGQLAAQDDFTWNMVTLEVWCAVENNIVIITASIPILRPLFSRKQPHSHASSTPHYNYGHHTSFHTRATTSSCNKVPEVELEGLDRGSTNSQSQSQSQLQRHTHSRQHTRGSSGSKKSSQESILPIMDEIVVTRTMRVQFDAEMDGAPMVVGSPRLERFDRSWD